MACQLQALPRAEMPVELHFQFLNLGADPVDFFGLLSGGRGKAAQLFHVALERVDYFSPLFFLVAGRGLHGSWSSLFGAGLGRSGRRHCRHGRSSRRALFLFQSAQLF